MLLPSRKVLNNLILEDFTQCSSSFGRKKAWEDSISQTTHLSTLPCENPERQGRSLGTVQGGWWRRTLEEWEWKPACNWKDRGTTGIQTLLTFGIWSTVLVLQKSQAKLEDIQRGAVGGLREIWPCISRNKAFQLEMGRCEWNKMPRRSWAPWKIKTQREHQPHLQLLSLGCATLTELAVPSPCVLTSGFSSQGIALVKSGRHSWKIMFFSCWKLFYACKSSQGTLWKTNQRALRMNLKGIYSQI